METASPPTPRNKKNRKVTFETSSITSNRDNLHTRDRSSLARSNIDNTRRSPTTTAQSVERSFVVDSSSPGDSNSALFKKKVYGLEKENQNSFSNITNLSANKRKTAGGNGLNSLRRTLRATVVATENANIVEPSSPSASKDATATPQQQAFDQSEIHRKVQTQLRSGHTFEEAFPSKQNSSTNSILAGEMLILEDGEESLLISPSTSQHENHTPTQADRSSMNKPAQYARKSDRRNSMRKALSITKKVESVTIPQLSPSLAKESKHIPQDREDTFVVKNTPNLSKRVVIQDGMDTTITQSSVKINGSQVRTSTSARNNIENEPAATTPYHHRGNGVCMDLSTMFSGQKSQRKMKYITPKRAPDSLHGNSSTIVHSVNRSVVSVNRSVVSVLPENDDWASKQCDTFTKWLNYSLLPSDDQEHEDPTLDLNMNRNQTGERASLRTLILYQQIARVRTDATALVNSQDMQKVRTTVKSEISKGKLAIRSDKDMYRNISLRQKITSLLLSYSTPWLRLGLEAIFGEIILPEFPHQFSPQKKSGNEPDNQSQIKSALRDFIKDRVLSDSVVLSKYTRKGCRMPSGNFEKRYSAEIRSLVLYRLMVLIFFIDRAKMANILDKSPRLFTKHSFVKSSKAVLEALCREFLEGQGDITKHLSRVGLKVHFKQDFVDELDFSIRNLAVDLRDGVRLTRMVEVLTHTKTKALLSSLRLPAVSRLQKLHNVGVALQGLRKFGVPITSDIAAHHIVDGHRDMVLKLMWSVVAHCCLRLLVDEKKVEEEIHTVLKGKKLKKDSGNRHGDSDPLELMPSSGALSDDDKRRLLLLRWCQAICSTFGLQVFDFTNSFADGKAVCLLIHYYHPAALRIEEILPTSNDLPLDPPPSETVLAKRHFNERANSQLASSRMSEIGGIPKMLPVTDTANIPEEKSMILCLSYMCARLVESSTEIRACILIQNQYRKYRSLVLAEEKNLAALIILMAWRNYKENYFSWQRKKYGLAVYVIENFMYCHRESLNLLKLERVTKDKQDRAILILQAGIRCYLVQCRIGPILVNQRAARTLQCFYRRYRARQMLTSAATCDKAAIDIQRCWRGSHPRHFLSIMVYSASLVQACVRGFFVRTWLKDRRSAAICIQRIWRGFLVQLNYQIDLLDIIAVQSIARRRIAIFARKTSLNSAVVIQLAVRRYLSVCTLLRNRARKDNIIISQSVARRYLAVLEIERRRTRYRAANLIQAIWRAYYSRLVYRRIRSATIQFQTYVRRRRGFMELARRRNAVEVMQCAARVSLARRLFLFLCEERKQYMSKVILCQSLVRRNIYMEIFMRIKRANIILQARCRAHQALSRYQRSKNSAISCQALVRGYFMRRTFQLRKASTCILQVQVRRYLCMNNFNHAKSASIILQAKWRGYQMKLLHKRQKANIVVLQTLVRGYLVRRNVVIFAARARICQSYIRRYLCRNVFKHTKRAVILLQAKWRGQTSKSSYQRKKLKVIRLQSFVRKYLVLCMKRKLERAVVRIQAGWRGASSYINYQLYRCDVITVQSVVRQRLGYREFLLRRFSVLRLQKFGRQFLAQLDMIRASKQIQKIYRGHLYRRVLHNLHLCATFIQRIFRGYVAKLHYQMDLVDVIIVQGVVRGWSARRQLVRKEVAAVRLQQSIRVLIARQELSRLRERKKEEDIQYHSTVVIQQLARGHIARCLMKKERAAINVQKTWRCYAVHVDFMLSVLSALAIQSLFRGILCRKMYRKTQGGFILLQAIARGASQRRQSANMKSSAVFVQSCFRMYAVRTNFLRHWEASVMIQKLTRGGFTRQDLVKKSLAAVEIQRMWRGYLANVEYVFAVFATIKIQSFFRMILVKRIKEELLHELLRKRGEELFRNKVAAKIQRAYRDHLEKLEMLHAALRIQVATREFLSKLVFRKLVFRVSLFQSIARGHLIRQKRSKRVRIAASRIKQASLRAERDPRLRLGARTLAALTILRKSTRLVEIMAAVCTLELSTRMSEVCCMAVVEAMATHILFSLVRTCNRSLPHVDLLHAILLTMMNIARYDYLWSRIDTMNAAEIFLDLVQMFRDRENVFSLAVVLLDRCVRFDHRIENMCKSRENLKRLKGVHALCVRKLANSGGRASIGQKTHSNTRNKLKHGMTRLNCPYDLRYGIKTLQKLIAMLEN